ncbi:divergent polysaccharide deacetylase family protein [Haemophilus influenzae]|uniref:divergent polysaccharide deacetylase family protein n=1 Tax=Haemophilus influenzae TaxID=727 RepID=UPI000E330318|nr:divergent polysaccharide deacetylase family protein [Haemophilus influenzae]AXP37284.1 divergent polysaccharide deacetylase family protein [Haemophilus influenzae]AXP65827.1 divergent polysaccharide deacetylase family protein [Haemophilus influenzae]AYO35551.1 divergent polysaccharide deacetylase family protein [Haemophilus influenzae]MCK8946416.1 divergent polysaccharide deacetylase family protein [Haemophilus influenzae]MCK9059717.1 divergent polysaccharide deacetylase family protein [Hae
MNILIKSAVKNFIVFSTALYTSFSFAQSKLAIVIDDVGYHLKEDAAIFAMPREISVAIIPAAPYARARNQEAKSQGRDILIHMPMQPISAIKIEDGGLHLGMSAAQVNDRVNTAKNIVRDAIGMNNHMGSAATADPQLMTYLMTALQEKHLFFLDSRTIGKSVAGKIAKEQGVRSLDRHIFLDDSNEFADVQRQFKAAIHYARKHGSAIAIGHPRPNTIAVLQAGLRNLPEDIQLVGMGNLWRNEKVIPPKPFILLFSEVPAPTSIEPFEPVGLLRGIPK